jgi:hypothetical protein
MANYKNLIDTVRAAMPAGVGRFIHGRLMDFSNSYSGEYPLATLLPFTIADARSTADGTWDRVQLIVGFWQQDRPDTTPEEREEIIDAMDLLSDEFIDALQDSGGRRITGIQKEPQYQMFQGTLSGFAVSFTLELLNPC